MPLFRIFCILLSLLFVCSAEVDSDLDINDVQTNDTNNATILSDKLNHNERQDVIVFAKVFAKLLEDFKRERLEATQREERCQERRIRSFGRNPEIIIVNFEEEEEITLTSLLYKEDEPWSACRRSCLTTRVRRCRLKQLCSMDVFVEKAYCYVPFSKCERTVKELLGQIRREETQTTTDENTTEPPEISNYHSTEKKSSEEFFEDYHESYFVQFPSKLDTEDYDHVMDFWNHILGPSDYNEEDSRIDDYKWMESKELQPKESPLIRPDKCGKSSVSVPFQMFRIIGGRDAIKDSWPWQVAILNRFKELFCGGTLISSRWVLTAAHCIKKKIFVRVGEHDITVADGEIEIKVEKSFQHPAFDRETIDSDIGMLKLTKDVFQMASKRLKKACLPQPGEPLPRKQPCVVIGWGKQKETHIFGSDVLQYVQGTGVRGVVTGYKAIAPSGSSDVTDIAPNGSPDLITTFSEYVPVAGMKACQRAYDSLEITKNMFCAGALRADACEGDSGGPLLCQDSDQKWVLQGVTSFGKGCGKENRLGVYVKVSNYIQWIQETIRLN